MHINNAVFLRNALYFSEDFIFIIKEWKKYLGE